MILLIIYVLIGIIEQIYLSADAAIHPYSTKEYDETYRRCREALEKIHGNTYNK